MEPKMFKVGQLKEADKWKCDESRLPAVALMREKAHFSAQAAILLAFLNGGQAAVTANDPLM